MTPLDSQTLHEGNQEAIYNLYMYLAHKVTPEESQTLQSVVARLESALIYSGGWKSRDIYRLSILKNAIKHNAVLANSKIDNLIYSKSGLTACIFTKPTGDISVVFKGTGSGEWIDNGEGLSGIPEENVYITYDKIGAEVYRKTLQNDYATEQQAEALNWFNRIAAKNNWNDKSAITVSGHSKGGNKAQFISIHSNLVDKCYSFDGHGFSPETLSALKKRYGAEFEERRQKIISFSADNDYVNVLGKRLVSENHIYYFEALSSIHYIEAILDNNGQLRPQCEQGRLSKYIENVSDELMNLNPFIRQYATLGIMNIFQKYLGEGVPVNGDTVSVEKTIAGIGIAIGSILHQIHRNSDM